MQLRNQAPVAVVTGATGGIGSAIVNVLSDRGFQVVQTDMNAAAVEAAVQRRPETTGHAADITDLEDVRELYRAVMERHGRIDAVIANAGAGFHSALGRITPEEFEKTFDVNVKGVLFTVQEALPYLDHTGSVVILGSIGSITPPPGTSLYSAAKAAVRTLARAWIQEPAGQGVRINLVSPGSVDTPSLRSALVRAQGAEAAERTIAHMGDQTPIGRLVTATEVANTVGFLVSDDATAITGVELFVDGGQAQI